MLQSNTFVVACGALLASVPAAAQDQLAIYGIVDVFVTNVRAEGLAPTTRIDSNGLLASRIGFRGSEALGGGLRSNFVLELGFNPSLGGAADANRLANRQAWVGLSGSAGELRLGRQNTPQFLMNGRYDAFTSATQASGWNNLFGAPPRTDNAIGLFSPSLGGWKLQALLARGASGGGTPVSRTAANQNSHWAAEYEGQGRYFGANYEVVKLEGQSATRRISLGMSWAAAPAWTLFGAAGSERRDEHNQDTRLLSLSLRRTLSGAASLSLGWAGLQDRLSGAGHGNASEISAMYRYLLSKRTTIYSAAAHLAQQGLRNSFFLGGSAVVEAGAQIRSPLPGGDINGVELGMVHSF
ncbi:MAG: porin [Pseudomonadota bacterium]